MAIEKLRFKSYREWNYLKDYGEVILSKCQIETIIIIVASIVFDWIRGMLDRSFEEHALRFNGYYGMLNSSLIKLSWTGNRTDMICHIINDIL